MNNESGNSGTGGNTSFGATTHGDGAGIQQASEMDNSTGKQVNNVEGDGATITQTNAIEQDFSQVWGEVAQAVEGLPADDQKIVTPLLGDLQVMSLFDASNASEAEVEGHKSKLTGVLQKLKPFAPMLSPIKAALKLTPVGAIAVPLAESVFNMVADS